jgi:predicted metal-dependent enzyme (double-stranded beta helix superfamily)
MNDAPDLAGLTQLVRSVAASPHWWADLVRYRAGERWYQRLDQTENHELWLLSWLPGQRTGFHDHLGSAGAFTVVRGELREHTVPAGRAAQRPAVLRRAVPQRPDPGDAGQGQAGLGPARRDAAGLRSKTVPEHRTEPGADGRISVAAFAAGQVRTFGPRHVHEVVNSSAQPAVSIHAYSPSLAGMRRYEMTPAGLVLVAVEKAEESW